MSGAYCGSAQFMCEGWQAVNEQTDKKYQVRRLQARDTFILAQKFHKWAGEILPLISTWKDRTQTKENATQADKEARQLEIAMMAFEFLLGKIEDLKPWVASLANLEESQLDSMPFDAPIVILSDAMELNADQMSDFLSSVLKIAEVFSTSFSTKSKSAMAGLMKQSVNSASSGSSK
jgi:hypothetical protein